MAVFFGVFAKIICKNAAYLSSSLFIYLSVSPRLENDWIGFIFYAENFKQNIKILAKIEKNNGKLASLVTSVSKPLSGVILLVFWERKIFGRNLSGKSYISWSIISTYLVRILSQLDKAVEHIKTFQNLYLFK